MILLYILLCFFFQAEDGIRDLVRSRGLGDVYKRQMQHAVAEYLETPDDYLALNDFFEKKRDFLLNAMSVSYTHLTLPTSDLV